MLSCRGVIVANKSIVGLRRCGDGGGEEELVLSGGRCSCTYKNLVLRADTERDLVSVVGDLLQEYMYARPGGRRKVAAANEIRRMPRDEHLLCLEPWAHDSAGPNFVSLERREKISCNNFLLACLSSADNCHVSSLAVKTAITVTSSCTLQASYSAMVTV